MPTKYQTEEKRRQPLKNAFENTASPDKLRGQLTKKNVTSLLILSAIILTLFATPTTTFANSNERDGGSPSQVANVTSTPSNGSPKSTTVPLRSIHMLDKTHGWALTDNYVLKTADGGLHWQNVIPANALGNATTHMSEPRGTFLNDQEAWVVADLDAAMMNTITVLHTTNGGKSWQNSIIHTPAGTDPDRPEFLNASVGWLQSYQVTSTGTIPAIFHTTDGGLHWNPLGIPKDTLLPSGIFFKDVQNGWETRTGQTGAQPSLDVTHDGGKTWQSQLLSALPGAGKSDSLSTKPPVLFGNNGLLPVEDTIAPPPGSKSSLMGLDLYVTHNGGQTWTPTKLVTANLPSSEPSSTTVYAMDSQHVWAALGNNLYTTSNGGQSWTQLPPSQQSIWQFDFVDPNNGWAITPTNLLHTTDGGHTWQQVKYSVDEKPIGTLTNSEQPTTTPPTGKQPTSAAPVGSSEKACGFLLYQQAAGNTGPTLLPDTGDQPHVACFLQAFQQCVPAAISFVINSKGSTGSTTTENDFSTKQQAGSCTISKTVNLNMEPQPKDTETCTRVEQTGANVSFLGCTKGGTITFPLVAPK